MAIINGVNFDTIVSISGVPKASITNVSGVPISAPLSCNSVSYGYSDGRRNPPEASCVADFLAYDQDPNSGILYLSGQCGVTTAPIGFYSDGAEIFFFDGASFTPDRPCSR